MIKIIKPRKKKKKRKPYYEVIFNYMIGDSDGDTSYEIEVMADNPYLERLVTLVTSLGPTKGHWGVSMDTEQFYNSYKEGQITEDDYYFLCYMSQEGGDWDNEDENPYNKSIDGEDENAWVFYELFRSQTEYSFLTLEDVDLFYYDEYGIKCKTEIVPNKEPNK